MIIVGVYTVPGPQPPDAVAKRLSIVDEEAICFAATTDFSD